MTQVPVGMSADELAQLLAELTIRVRSGDSYEGRVTWTLPIPDDPEAPLPEGWPSLDADFWVTAGYRVGNREGQGGFVVIGRYGDGGT